MARRSLVSSSNNPPSSATRKTSCRTPVWVSLSPIMRASKSGPISEIVARSGCPLCPKTSHSATGHAANRGNGTPSRSQRSRNFGDSAPGIDIPVKSPLTSAMNTGTPARLNRSAIRCSVTVFPVPVAPVMSPWRLANAGNNPISWSNPLMIGNAATGSVASTIGFVGAFVMGYPVIQGDSSDRLSSDFRPMLEFCAFH